MKNLVWKKIPLSVFAFLFLFGFSALEREVEAVNLNLPPAANQSVFPGNAADNRFGEASFERECNASDECFCSNLEEKRSTINSKFIDLNEDIDEVEANLHGNRRLGVTWEDSVEGQMSRISATMDELGEFIANLEARIARGEETNVDGLEFWNSLYDAAWARWQELEELRSELDWELYLLNEERSDLSDTLDELVRRCS